MKKSTIMKMIRMNLLGTVILLLAKDLKIPILNVRVPDITDVKLSDVKLPDVDLKDIKKDAQKAIRKTKRKVNRLHLPKLPKMPRALIIKLPKIG
jgi:hypothetical protein